MIDEFLRRYVWLVAGVFLTLTGSDGMAAELKSAPFVAGFERFVRHQEIDAVSGGQLLLSELSCTACHEAASNDDGSVDLKPKLGPDLQGVGNRIASAWMIRFLSSPQIAKPGTTMPDMLAGLPDKERQPATQALAAFLSTLQQPYPEIKGTGANPVPHEFWKLGDAEQGRQLYHRVGCVSCHEVDPNYETVETKPTPLDQLLEQLDEDELKDLGLAAAARRVKSVPHGDLPAKYSRQSLTFFLLDPHRTRPSGRMPNLKLGVVEAADIAAWLLRDDPTVNAVASETAAVTEDAVDGKPASEHSAIVQKGRRLFTELRCVNCHRLKEMTQRKPARPLSGLDLSKSPGCVGKHQPGRPHYALDDKQLAALKSALSSNTASDAVPSGNDSANTAQRVDLQLLRLNCLACHERDSKGGVGRYRRAYFETVGHIDIGDEGRLPPPLTGVGGKLHTAWLARVLKGTGDVRDHMRIRMPLFPHEQVKELPGLLATADLESGGTASEKEVFGDVSKLAEAGRMLLDTGCVQCHPLRGDALPGVVGIDLEGITSRVRPQWFYDFLLNPGRLKPRTRMPTFFPNGKSQNATILKGDTEQQIAAMWAYLRDVNRLKLPPKIERARSQNYELVPQDEPIVLRTFMKEAGTHAIAVGFPKKVHIAFDAEQVRLATAWRGRFLDAQGTWFVRFAPPADPLGESSINFPPGVPFAVMSESSDQKDQFPAPSFDAQNAGYQFRGYRLDKSGVPTFLYRFDRFDVEDTIQPDADQRLKRRFTITDRNPDKPPASVWFRVHSGKTLTLKAEASRSSTDEQGLTVSVSDGIEHAGELHQREGSREWLVPLKIEQKKVIEVQYEW